MKSSVQLTAPCCALRRVTCAAIAFLLLLVARAEVITLATYNIENYGPADRMTADGFRKAYPKPEAEKRALRRVIRALNADVLVLQEMGDERYLDELRRDLKTEGLDYPHAIVAKAADTDRHVAMLAKRALRGVVTHGDLEFSYFGAKERVKRGLLEATIATDAGELTIFGVHLKSRFTDRPDDPMSAIRRAAEAVAVRDRVLRRFPAPARARFVILGDCNDHKESRPLAALQKKGRTEIASLLGAGDSRGEVWSHFFHREDSYSRVDHILVSPLLKPAVHEGAARIFDGAGVGQASDHRPVVVQLDLGPSQAQQR